MDPDEINATLTSTGIGNTLSGSSSDLDLARSGANVSGAVPSCVYSGADIKLVAHLPPPTEEQRDDQIEQAEQELERIREQIGQAPPIRDTDAVTDAVDQTLDETGTTSSEARSLRDQIGAASLEATLWPEGSAERTAAEAQVAELQEQLDALPNEGRASNLSELMQRETELVRLLESLNAERTTPPAAVTKILAEITTLSVSTHREKYQVRTLGSVYPRSVTRGPRSIAGSVVFTTFYTHVFNEFLEQTSVRSTGVGDWDRFRWTSYITDQMPPLDISIVFANEYGNISYMALLGVEFMNEGMVMSIEDLFVEGTAQYIARDIELIRQVGRRDLTINRGVGQSLTGTSLLMDDIRRRSTGRRNPFL